MAYVDLAEVNGIQTIAIPSKYHFNVDRVSMELRGGCLIVRPVPRRPNIETLFSMIDSAREDEGDLVIDRSTNVTPVAKEYF